MELTQQDYEERKGRQLADEASDDDRRLIKLYEREGFVWPGSSTANPSDSTPNAEPSNEEQSPSTAPTTERLSSKAGGKSSGARSTAGRGRTSESSGAE